MRRYAYRILNVFAESVLTGNPLCVFEDATGLTDVEMQALALQFNLSETTFILPSAVATARVRIFTPTFEMPFAGHPTLGTAQVVRELHGTGGALTLDMKAGVIPVTSCGNVWTLEARKPTTRAAAAEHDIASMLGLSPSDVGASPLWVDTGSEQLIVPLASVDAVLSCTPDPRLLARYGSSVTREGMAYVWASATAATVVARFFFLKRGSLVEDPGTGSACANLGGWLLMCGTPLPFELTVHQGEQVGRPCQLGLRVDATGRIFVSGNVIELGRGAINL
jgi:trans-2,3-dihydro-3-hydroxyanthranilate isomerase